MSSDVLSPAVYPLLRQEKGHKTVACIAQSLFPFHRKQDLSISQTAFEHLIQANQTSLHHMAVALLLGADRREQSPTLGIHPEEQIARLTRLAHVFMQRCMMLGMKMVP